MTGVALQSAQPQTPLPGGEPPQRQRRVARLGAGAAGADVDVDEHVEGDAVLDGGLGQCAHVMGWAARRESSHSAMAPLMDTRARFEAAGLPVEIVAGGSTGTYNIDLELAGLTELQAGSYCVMDLDYRRIGGRAGDAMTDFEMAITVVATVVSVAADRVMVDAGLKAFSTDKPFPPEAVERPGVEYGFAGDEHGRLSLTDPSRAPKLGERIEFFPPHCDPTFNLYDRVHVVRGTSVQAVWDIAARGRSD